MALFVQNKSVHKQTCTKITKGMNKTNVVTLIPISVETRPYTEELRFKSKNSVGMISSDNQNYK